MIPSITTNLNGDMVVESPSCKHHYDLQQQARMCICGLLWDDRRDWSIPNCVSAATVKQILQYLNVPESHIPEYRVVPSGLSMGADTSVYQLSVDGVLIDDTFTVSELMGVSDKLWNDRKHRLRWWGTIPPEHADAVQYAISEADITIPKHKI